MRLPLALAILLLTATPALAVPVGTSADTRPAAPQHRAQWKTGGVQLKVDGSYLSGNVNLTNLSVNAAGNYNAGPHQLFVDAGNFYTANAGTVIVQRVAASALYAYANRENMNTYAYVTGAHDLSIQLNHRYGVGAGACVHRFFPEHFSLFLLSLNPVYEVEGFANGTAPATWRGVGRFNAIKPLGEAVELGVDSFFSPAVPDVGDVRVYGEAYVRCQVFGDALAIRFTVADEYDNRPQPGVQPNDFGVFTSLETRWGD